MNISLTSKLEEMVQKRVESGLYNSASEVVREALRLLEQFERVQEAQIRNLREQVLIGVEQIERGQTKAFDDKTVEGIKAQGRRRRKERKAD